MSIESSDKNLPQENLVNRSRILEKIKKYARLATAFGVLSYAGSEILPTVKQEIDYKAHIDTMSKERKNGYQILRTELVNKIGQENLKKLELHDKEAYLRKQNRKEVPPQIKGFENLGLDNSVFQNAWNENNGSYPKGWINDHISQIAFTEKDGKNSAYGEKLKSRNPEAGYNLTSRAINFYTFSVSATMARLAKYFEEFGNKESKAQTMEMKGDIMKSFDVTFSHELGHANDWDEDLESEIDLRIALLLKIMDRLNSDHPAKTADRYLRNEPSYSDEIKKDSKNDELLLKAKEYWGDIVQNYFQYPDWTKEHFPEDFKIVDDFVKRTDPGFNPSSSAKQRDTIFDRHSLQSKK